MSNKSAANIFIYFSLLIVIIFFIIMYRDGYTFWSSLPIKFDVTGQVGDFIGGTVGTIISAAGFYFLYLTFNDQRASFEKERLESKFFDLIKIHRDNVSELRFDATQLEDNTDSLYIEKYNYEGKSVFNVIFYQFVMCKNELSPFFKMKNPCTVDYEKKLLSDPYILTNNISPTLIALIDICYCIVFYGLTSEGLLILEKLFKGRYKDDFIQEVLKYLSLKPANDTDILAKWTSLSKKKTRAKKNVAVGYIYNWRKTKSFTSSQTERPLIALATDYHNRYTKYYTGHQSSLGHYYRHLFQSVNYINSQVGIGYKEKYAYIKVLRAQLSTYEQAILFLNSLSIMGKSWELHPEENNQLKGYSKSDFELITKYNLIKNLPGDTLYGIPFKMFYPNVEYENETKLKSRNERYM